MHLIVILFKCVLSTYRSKRILKKLINVYFPFLILIWNWILYITLPPVGAWPHCRYVQKRPLFLPGRRGDVLAVPRPIYQRSLQRWTASERLEVIGQSRFVRVWELPWNCRREENRVVARSLSVRCVLKIWRLWELRLVRVTHNL